MSITLEVNEVPYTNFKSVSISRSMQNLSSSFDIVATINTFQDFPIKLQAEVLLKIENKKLKF